MSDTALASILNGLREVDLLSHFSDEHLELLAQNGRLRHVTPGEAVFQQGEEAAGLYLILQGNVVLQRSTPTGLVDFWRLGGGELLGETTFLTDRAVVDAALAEGDVSLVTFERDRLLATAKSSRLFERHLFWAFWRSTANNLRLSNQRLAKFFDKRDEEARPRIAAAKGSDLEVDHSSKEELFREQMLSDTEVELLASVARERKFSPGHVIFAEGDLGNEMYVILDGEVTISKYIPGAGDEALAFLRRGDYFGEMVLLGDNRRSANATARTDCAVVLALPSQAVLDLLEDRNESSLELLKLLCTIASKRVAKMAKRIADWHALAGGDYF